MRILLPPSEGKERPLSGPTLNLDSLSFPELSAHRKALLAELTAVSARDDALTILNVGKTVADEVYAQQDILNQPCVPAHQLYTGVLYHAMNLQNLTDAQLAHAADHILIFSGLFGVNRLTDLIPSYRLAMGVVLPQAGNTKTFWKKALAGSAIAGDELVIDARSGGYRVWDPPKGTEHVTINAVRIKHGERKVVSHNAKHYRGLLAGELIRSSTVLDDAEELAEFAHILVDRGAITSVELDPPDKIRALTLVENQDL
ncbi:Protein of uncharacterised function (DUF328) [Arcanobacterium haemolyticum]|uniref:YaaA family protein n=1 Tax=Arcanobacterium haemolyticum TaxID=28264 RepID=UPI000D8A13C5|nr:peroxide stress protein YaaA [Arcanobacterium haemolyticum]SPT75192.1 Protein of uncharacterised function (DUF328) [Arcanobacterium haemolyticum]